MAIQRIACLNCGSSHLIPDRDNHLVCDNCGSVFRTKDNICTNCLTVNPSNSVHCNQCGERLKRRCTVCGHDNPGNAEYCANCKNALDILEYISRRYAEEGRQDREVLVASKRADAAFVDEQSIRLREADERWKADLRTQKTEQVRQERIVFMVIVGAAVVTLVVCAVTVFLTLSPGG